MSYLILASLLLLAVWPAYYLLLRYSDRYGINRWLLLAGMVAVCALPLAKLSSPVPQATLLLRNTVEYAVVQTVASVEEVTTASSELAPEAVETMSTPGTLAGEATVPIAAPTPPRSWSWWTVYAIGFGIMGLLMGVRMLSVLTLHLRSRPNGDAAYRLLHPAASPGQAFTFGTALYFSIDVPDSQDFDQVHAHERVHARQLHTMDVLLSEVFLCLFWFHPAAWWMRSQLRANLEYLVDATVIWDGLNPRNYQLALVRQSQGAQSLALALPFSEPSLKSRISRMTGLPNHWAVAAVASIGMAVWLSFAGLTVLGSSNAASNYSLPNDFHALELHFNRLPTPTEYWNLQTVVSQLEHTNFNVYEPCKGTEGRYVMQLSYYLEQTALFNTPLAETERLADFHTFKLTKRSVATTKIPDNLGFHSLGYYVPEVVPTNSEQLLANSNGFTLYVDGRQVNLTAHPQMKDGMGGLAALQSTYLNLLPDYSIAPATLAEINHSLQMTPDAQLACLLKVNHLSTLWKKSVVHTVEGAQVHTQAAAPEDVFRSGNDLSRSFREAHPRFIKGYLRREMLSNNNHPERIKNQYYLNSIPITLEDLMEVNFPPQIYIQTGRTSRSSPNGYQPVTQIITDMPWN